ncbi:MAG TPA: VWA domain-containing protein, partial [Gemmatimonadaceae bacterium]|nr:VWA domain-containing protein [Gemmatimonadaceae bacterium]
MFLHKIPYRSVRRQKLRHLLLLALRCLALLLLVAAFARPFVKHAVPAGPPVAGARERIILLDQSYSMGYGDHWQRAVAAAHKAVSDLGTGDRATLVLFAHEPHAVTVPTGDHGPLDRAINHAKVSSGNTRYGPALKLASQMLAGSNLPRREVVLISDFQRSGWLQRDEIEMPAGTVVTPIDVSDKVEPDVAVTDVTTDRDTANARDRVVVAARIANTGSKPVSVNAVLNIGGRDIQTRHVTVDASGSAQARFASQPIPATPTRGLVRITHDALPENDTYRFTLAPDEAVSVLIVQPANPRRNQSLFVRRALEIGDRPRFDVDVRSARALRPSDLEGRSLVILNEVRPPGGAVGARLQDIVAQGAGLLIVPGDQQVDAWPADWRARLPVRVGPVVDRTSAAGGTLAAVEYSSPVFEIFQAPHSGDFSTVRMFRYRALSATGDSGVLARMDDGTPALVETPDGEGKLLVWGSSLDEYWTDLPLQPVFLPFMHELARYAGRYADPRPAYVAGEVLDLSRHGELTAMFRKGKASAADANPALVLESPSGKRTRLHASGGDHLAELDEAGFYELRDAATAIGSGRPVAVNVDPAESDLSHVDPKELVAAVASRGPGAVAGSSPAATASPRDMERHQKVWWYLLIGALLVLAAESLLSNRLSRSAA